VPSEITTLQSPDHVQMSLAAAIVLGLRRGRFQRGGYTRCLNLLLTYDQGCAANCAYCGLARDRQGEYAEKSFIRVEWPTAPTDEIIERAAGRTRWIERMCISMITHRRSNADTLDILSRWRRSPGLDAIPVSILSNPSTMSRDDLIDLRDAGAERFTIAVDAATEPIFDATRGRGVRGSNRWHQYWDAFDMAHEVFGREKVGVHLICGMGETEREMIETMDRARAKGEYGCLQLFAFNPESGSRMQDDPRVELGQFRRVQLARYLLDKGLVRAENMSFDPQGRIVDFGVPPDIHQQAVDTGVPFRTSGCPGSECDVSSCNRPFGDGPPTDFSSFPFPPDRREIDEIREQLEDYDGRITRADVAQRTLDAIEQVSALPCRG